jgi:glycine/sarcosine N-methyltransferase
VYQATRYRAGLRGELDSVLEESGFSEIGREMPDRSGYYQPVVSARRWQL